MLFFTVSFLLSAVLCHIQVNVPPVREAEEIFQLRAPCGGNNNPQEPRTVVSIKGYKAKIEVADKDSIIVINLGKGENSTTTFPQKIGGGPASQEVKEFPLDFLGQGLKDDDKVTVQIISTSGDGVKYACADLILTGYDGSSSTTPSTASSTPSPTVVKANAIASNWEMLAALPFIAAFL